ncbi:MAG TPA: immunoglobulin-like domain-containing protein [Nocardioides sp.]|nr:immunoglobulin-like domain-containing protein [Nocardioides sp.]
MNVTTTPIRPRGGRRTARLVISGLAAAVALAAAATGPAPVARADETDLTTGLIARWRLDETSGTTAADSSGNGRNGTVNGTASWNAGDGFTFNGGTNGSGNYIKLPDNLLAGVDDLTVDFDVLVDPTLSGNWFMYNLGNSATFPNGTGYLFTTNDSSGRYRATIAANGFATEQSVSRPTKLPTGVWKHVTYTIDGGAVGAPGSAKLYEDGVLVASNDNLTTRPSLLGTPDGTTTLNQLGRSAYGGDLSFKGKLRDFRLYDRVLTAAESAELAGDVVTPVIDADAAALTLGDTSAVVSDLALPATGASATTTIAWASSDPARVSSSGVVTRPAHGSAAAAVTLTATVTRGAETRTRTFDVTVLPDELDDTGKAQEAVAAVALVHPDDVRGNLTLPTSGLHATTLAWSSAAPGVVSATGEVDRPAYGEPAVDVTLTVTATKGTATASRDIVVRVQPEPATPDYEGYAFAYFAGESTDDGEKIYLGASRGNDPLDYDELNDGKPVLESAFGEKGLRDPFIIRSHEGDRFYLLATDLKAYPAVDFGEAQETGSKYVEIWESTDLVHWSDQRHVKVSSDFAGNTWAPEAFYDEAAGEYVVYWASALYPTTDTAGRDINTQYQRMMYATTRDFVTFSAPKPWIDVKRGTGRGMIDATVVEDGGTFYRVVKDEASMTPRQERSTDLRATVSGSLPTTTSTPGWQLVKERIGVGQPNPWGGTFTNGEGPTVFRDNEDPDRWYLFIDQPSYHGGQGYLAFTTDDIGSGSWTSVPTADLPSSPRHGTVIPVTQAELDALRAGFQPELLVESAGDVAVTTRAGTAPALPAKVAATFGDGTTGEVAVEWDAVDPASYDEAGTFTVTGTVSRGSADHPVATVTVTDAADPVVTVGSEADGADGWWVTSPATASVAATDDTGVDRVEHSLDGGPWVEVDGGTASLAVVGDGVHEVRARAHDVTGNTSVVVTGAVKVDTEAPVSRASRSGRTVTVRAADATSGVGVVQYRLDGGSWTTYTAPFGVGDEAVDVEYRAVDRAGTVEAANTLVVPATGDDLSPTAVVAVASSDTVRFGTDLPIAVRVSTPDGVATGSIRAIADGQVLASADLADGRASIVVDTGRLSGPGRRTIVIRYDGDDTHRAGEDQVQLTLTRARSTTTLSLGAPDRTGRGAVATVRVATSPSGVAVGRLSLVLQRGTAVVRRTTVTVPASGRVTWRLPQLRAGRWSVRALVAQSASATGSGALRSLTVR